jgi:phosphoglycolate phosphatase-like HAD superfamily hydrolase
VSGISRALAPARRAAPTTRPGQRHRRQGRLGVQPDSLGVRPVDQGDVRRAHRLPLSPYGLKARGDAEGTIHRLVLWNIDLTLLDVTKVTRAAYAEAFAAVTGRPLVQLPQMVGKTEPEIFFDALGRNGVSLRADGESERLLAPFGAEFATRLAARRDLLTAQGTLLPGAAETIAAVAGLGGVVQSVLTGSSRPNASLKLRAFGLDRHLDLAVGGFAGSEPYPLGALLRATRLRAEEKYPMSFAERLTVYIGDSPRDVEAARNGGAMSVAVASGRASSAELRDAGADLVLPDLIDPEPLITLLAAPA